MKIKIRRTEAYTNKKKTKINPFVIKSNFESRCKRFRKSAIRENFILKPEIHMKETLSNNRGNYIRQYKQVKKEAVASFLHLFLNNI